MQGVSIGLSDGLIWNFKPEDILVVMTSSAFSTKGSDGRGRIDDTKHRQDSCEDRWVGRAKSLADRSPRPPKRTGSFACFQQVSSNWTLQIDSAVILRICHWVQGRQNEGSMGRSRIGRGDEGERESILEKKETRVHVSSCCRWWVIRWYV